ncbi:PAS domain S-box protein [Chloroflexota bacterium]
MEAKDRTREESGEKLAEPHQPTAQLEASCAQRKLVEKAFTTTDSQLAHLLDSSLALIYTCQPTDDYQITFVSANVKMLLGYELWEFSKYPVDRIHPEDMRRVSTELSRMSEKGQNTYEYRLRHKDGTYRWVCDRVRLVRDVDGNPLELVGSLIDISERKQIEERLRFGVHMMNAVGQAVVATDLAGTITYCNRFAQTLYGWPAKEAVGRSVLDIIGSGGSRAEATVLMDCLKRGESWSGEFPLQRRDGSTLIGMLAATPFVDDAGTMIGVILVCADITDRKHMEDELYSLCERESKLRRKLEAEMNGRAEFMRALLHELKTPLTPIMASSGLLVEQLRDEALLSLARSIDRGASNLNRKIDTLLDVARGELGMLRLRFAPVDLLQLLHSAFDYTSPMASKHGQSFALDLPPFLPLINADEERLEQVVLNLISNACKFTPEGTRITLRAKERNDRLVVEVEDTGQGIPEQEQRRLFEPYRRLTDGGEHLSGLGLGLALSKRLIELHGGQIWVNSIEGKGSTFAFSLPLQAPSQMEDDTER